MPMTTQQPVMYIQVNTSDRESTAQFYADVFGWHIHHEPTYTWFEASAAAPAADQPNLAPFIVLIEPGASMVYSRSA
jgi:predicted enzyme related to lactoylglutathione lyase